MTGRPIRQPWVEDMPVWVRRSFCLSEVPDTPIASRRGSVVVAVFSWAV